jgi:hypothetical protein
MNQIRRQHKDLPVNGKTHGQPEQSQIIEGTSTDFTSKKRRIEFLVIAMENLIFSL